MFLIGNKAPRSPLLCTSSTKRRTRRTTMKSVWQICEDVQTGTKAPLELWHAWRTRVPEDVRTRFNGMQTELECRSKCDSRIRQEQYIECIVWGQKHGGEKQARSTRECSLPRNSVRSPHSHPPVQGKLKGFCLLPPCRRSTIYALGLLTQNLRTGKCNT